jgi:hypothetical protein
MPKPEQRLMPKNEAAVLAAVEHGPLSRSQIIEKTGVDGDRLKHALGALLGHALVAEILGRPPRIEITANGRAKIKIWHAMRGDGKNRPQPGADAK